MDILRAMRKKYIEDHKDKITEAEKFFKEKILPLFYENDIITLLFSSAYNSDFFDEIEHHFNGLKSIGLNIRYGCQTCMNIRTIHISMF